MSACSTKIISKEFQSFLMITICMIAKVVTFRLPLCISRRVYGISVSISIAHHISYTYGKFYIDRTSCLVTVENSILSIEHKHYNFHFTPREGIGESYLQYVNCALFIFTNLTDYNLQF